MKGPAAWAEVILLTITASGCARHSGTTLTVRDVVGCYELTRLEWDPMPGTSESASLYSPPSSIRLTSDSAVPGREVLAAQSPGSPDDDGYLIKTVQGAGNESFQEGIWRIRDGTVVLQWPPGLAAVRFSTIRHGDNLKGPGQALLGENALGSKGDIELRRIRCQP